MIQTWISPLRILQKRQVARDLEKALERHRSSHRIALPLGGHSGWMLNVKR